MNPVTQLTGAVVAIAIAALFGIFGGVLLILLAKHDADAQARFRSAPPCASAHDALGGRNCTASTSGIVVRKYVDRNFPAADVSFPEAAGKVLVATFSNASDGELAWSAIPSGTAVPVRLWARTVVSVDGTGTIYDPENYRNAGYTPFGVAIIVASLALGAFAVVAILGERRRLLALRP